MSVDYIWVRTDIHAVPEVVRLSRILGRSIGEVVGTLIQFWSWAQAHTEDGSFAGLDVADIAAACHVPPKFLAALVEVSWLVCDHEGVAIPNFDRWMSRGAKRRLSETLKKRRQRAAETDVSRSCPDRVPKLSRLHRDTNGTRGEERREELTSAVADVVSSEPPQAAREPPKQQGPPEDALIVFPCVGPLKEWRLTQSHVDQWQSAYPALDITAECRKALAWLSASPSRRKTAKGMPRFLVGWFGRAVDYGGARQPTVSGASSEWRDVL